MKELGISESIYMNQSLSGQNVFGDIKTGYLKPRGV